MKMTARIADWIRWRRLLASCDYDPGSDDELRDLSDRDFIIAGCPRSGTSLLAAQLFRPPSVVTCVEPWDGLRMPVHHLVSSLRSELALGSLSRGRLDIDALEQERRVQWVREGAKTYPVDVAADYLLGVKWPAFWRYVPLLGDTKFLVCVRDPREVISSFSHVGGRLREGFEYDVAFNSEMNENLAEATSDPEVRRALVWEYINSRLLPHLERPNVQVVRYERWLKEPEGTLESVGDFLETELSGSLVDIREPKSVADGRVDELVDAYCPSAEALGYGRR